MNTSIQTSPSGEVTVRPPVRVYLLFGLPESGVEAVARAVHGSGIGLASDAGRDAPDFAISQSLDALAADINAACGTSAESLGPLITANQSIEESRRRIDACLDGQLARARRSIRDVLPVDTAETSILIVAAAMNRFPSFWIKAFEQAGIDLRPVLLHRNPLAAAQIGRSDHRRALRRTIFHLHYLALEAARAAPNTLAVAIAGQPQTIRAAFGLADDPPRPELVPAHPSDDADLTIASIVSEQTRELDHVLRQWPSLDKSARMKSIAALMARSDESVTLVGTAQIAKLEDFPPALEQAPRPASAPVSESSGREATPLLIHYHIFKNAGTSVDKMLKANFGDTWIEKEFSGPPATKREDMARFLRDRPEIMAFSSHTAILPVPNLPGRRIMPILFVRHPLLRLRSAYLFERQQQADTRGAIVAKSADLSGYLTWMLDDPKMRLARNLQTLRLAAGTPGPLSQERDRALKTLAALPFVGLVEAYPESVQRLGMLLRPLFPEFAALALHENASSESGSGTIGDRLDALRDEIGSVLFDRLLAENTVDLEVFETVRAGYTTAS